MRGDPLPALGGEGKMWLLIALAALAIACGLCAAYCFGHSDGIRWAHKVYEDERGAALSELAELDADLIGGSAGRPILRRCRETIARLSIVADDWTRTYASDMCSPEHVEAARRRIADGGGTLAYIAYANSEASDVMQAIDAELAKPA